MVGPLVVLAVGAGLGGLIGAPWALLGHPEWNLLGEWLTTSVGPEMEIAHHTELLFMGVSTGLAVAGILVARTFYLGGYRAPAQQFAAAMPGLVKAAYNKFWVDEFYDSALIRPLRQFSSFLYRVVDRILIDQILVNGTAAIVDIVGRIARSLQSGDGQRYMAVFAMGAAALVFFATRPTLPSSLKVTVSGTTVTVDAGRAGRPSLRGLTYAFDFDDDGRPEVKGTASEARYTYETSGSHTIRVTVTDPRWHTQSSVKSSVDLDGGGKK
jgi:hypothetical protein